jgi:hypothetical protein
MFVALGLLLNAGCGKVELPPAVFVKIKALPILISKVVGASNGVKWVVQVATGEKEIETSMGTISVDPAQLISKLVHEGTIFKQVSSPSLILIDKNAESVSRWDLGPEVARLELLGSDVARFKLEILNEEPFQVVLWVDSDREVPLEIRARLVLKDAPVAD